MGPWNLGRWELLFSRFLTYITCFLSPVPLPHFRSSSLLIAYVLTGHPASVSSFCNLLSIWPSGWSFGNMLQCHLPYFSNPEHSPLVSNTLMASHQKKDHIQVLHLGTWGFILIYSSLATFCLLFTFLCFPQNGPTYSLYIHICFLSFVPLLMRSPLTRMTLSCLTVNPIHFISLGFVVTFSRLG